MDGELRYGLHVNRVGDKTYISGQATEAVDVVMVELDTREIMGLHLNKDRSPGILTFDTPGQWHVSVTPSKNWKAATVLLPGDIDRMVKLVLSIGMPQRPDEEEQ